MQINLENAHVLHRRSYRETSLLVELFTEQYGRIGAIAKGAARSMQALQPFQPLLVSWIQRRGELVTLTQFESPNALSQLDDRATLCGFYVNELLLQALIRNDPHPQLYRHYSQTLRDLAIGDNHRESVLRLFECQLLEEMGYGVTLAQDAEGHPISAEANYRFQPAMGATWDPGGGTTNQGVAISGNTLLQLSRGKLTDERSRAEAKRLLRTLLVEHIGDKPLFSRAWFEEY
ncbi:MAG: DNA repair protein RecO [Gammaproteobacteria bacterium]